MYVWYVWERERERERAEKSGNVEFGIEMALSQFQVRKLQLLSLCIEKHSGEREKERERERERERKEGEEQKWLLHIYFTCILTHSPIVRIWPKYNRKLETCEPKFDLQFNSSWHTVDCEMWVGKKGEKQTLSLSLTHTHTHTLTLHPGVEGVAWWKLKKGERVKRKLLLFYSVEAVNHLSSSSGRRSWSYPSFSQSVDASGNRKVSLLSVGSTREQYIWWKGSKAMIISMWIIFATQAGTI